MKQKKATLMAKTLGSQTLSISIDCQPARVYEFVSNPENLPKWAKAFCKSVTKSNDDWIMETPREIDESQVCRDEWFWRTHPELCVRALLDDAVEFHPEVTLAGGGLLDVEPAF